MQGALQALQGTCAEDCCELHLVHLWLLSYGTVNQAAKQNHVSGSAALCRTDLLLSRLPSEVHQSKLIADLREHVCSTPTICVATSCTQSQHLLLYAFQDIHSHLGTYCCMNALGPDSYHDGM